MPASLLVKRDRAVVRLEPKGNARRRGELVKGSRMRPLEAVRGPACDEPWYRVHSDAWLCGEDAEPSPEPAAGVKQPVVPPGQTTPWSYAFVREIAMEYRLEGKELAEVREVAAGFGFGVQGVVTFEGTPYFKTAEGALVPRAAAVVSGRTSELAGSAIEDPSAWPIGFVNARRAFAYREPSAKQKLKIGKVARYTPFRVLEQVKKKNRVFFRFDAAAWLDSDDVRVATPAPLPAGVGPDERWIDVDTKQQILTAYVGAKPVFVTLVSTGRQGPSRTEPGEHRIWAKVAAIAMDNTDEEMEEDAASVAQPGADAGPPAEERHLYSLHDVPWAQFFFESYALHGVYWHDRFGNRRSHGCVNLSPRDARWLFDWTSPAVPDGFWAIHASKGDQGTLVRVR